MGTARSILFTVLSIFLIAAGIAGIVTAVFILRDRISSAESSVFLSVLTTVLITAFSILNIITGAKGIKNYNRRTNSAVMIRLPEFSIILCFLSVIFVFINGTRVYHIIALGITGLLIPVIFIYAAVKKSYI